MKKFMSIDPALNNTGVVIGTMDNTDIYPESWCIFVTKPDSSKKVRKSSDTIKRCKHVYEGVAGLINTNKPDLIFVETPSGSKTAAGSKTYGLVCMLIATIKPPPIQVTPQEVKLMFANELTASKETIMALCLEKYPSFPYEFKIDGTMNKSKMEHICDAIAIAYTGFHSNECQRLLSFI